VKAGFDPTAADMHLGHTVLLRKLRQFQDLGHIVYFLIGDWTARIGDPSGVNQARPELSLGQVRDNARTYRQQVFKVLDERKTRVVFNSDWFDKMPSSQVLRLAGHSSLAQILARADFNQRYRRNKNISLLELFYPLLQAYDSVQLKADVELGGTDQRFNLLFGRQLQQDFAQEPQVVMMMPILEGLDGRQKMSKSLGNYVALNDRPQDMFGKIMSVSDELMWRYYELLTDEDLQNVKAGHPMAAKKKLAALIVEDYWGRTAAIAAAEEFEKVFQKRDFKDVELVKKVYPVGRAPAGIAIIDLVDDEDINLKLLLGLKGKNELRRLVAQGAVRINGEKIGDPNHLLEVCGREYKIQAGRRRFARISLAPAS
ncbi:MAG: tyrosine--tRNA ligase, partial [Candidatus Omnitrophota bacterium]